MWLLPGRRDTELCAREAAEPCNAALEHRQPGLVAPNDSWELRRHQVWIFRGQALRNLTATGQAGRQSHFYFIFFSMDDGFSSGTAISTTAAVELGNKSFDCMTDAFCLQLVSSAKTPETSGKALVRQSIRLNSRKNPVGFGRYYISDMTLRC